MAWYVNANGQTLGPVDEAQVVAWIKGGTLLSGSVCVVGSQQWTDLTAHPAFAAALLNAAPPPPHPGASSAEARSGAHAAVSASVRRPTPNPVAHAMGTGLRKTGRWLLLGFIVLILFGMSATGGIGLVVGAALAGWGAFGYKRSRRTAVELVVGRESPARWAAGLTAAVGFLLALVGMGGIAAQHGEASRKEEAAAASKKQAVQDEARRKELQANLLAEAPGKAKEWRTKLKELSDGLTSIKTNDDLHAKFTELSALRDQAKKWLGQLDTKPPDAVAAESEIESTVSFVQAMTDFIDGVASFQSALKNGKEAVAKRSWLEADQSFDEALQRIPALQAADTSFRAFVVGGFDPVRKKAEVTALKAGIAGAVASTKKQQAVAEAAANEAARSAKFIKESCAQLSQRFGPGSSLSEIQKDEAWKAYDGKDFSWDLQMVEADSKVFGGFTVQFKCASNSPSLISDVMMTYPKEMKSAVMGLQKGSVYRIEGRLGRIGTLLGLTATPIPAD